MKPAQFALKWTTLSTQSWFFWVFFCIWYSQTSIKHGRDNYLRSACSSVHGLQLSFHMKPKVLWDKHRTEKILCWILFFPPERAFRISTALPIENSKLSANLMRKNHITCTLSILPSPQYQNCLHAIEKKYIKMFQAFRSILIIITQSYSTTAFRKFLALFPIL